MKKFSVACLCLILASFIAVPNKAAYSQARNPKSPAYVEGEVLVKLRADVADISDLEIPEFVFHAPGAQVERLGGRARDINLIRLNGRLSVEQAIAQAQADPRVEYAEPNYIYETSLTPDDPHFRDEWGLMNTFSSLSSSATPADIGATRAWDITTGSDDLVVAVIDTGIDVSHEDLAANIWTNPREIAGNGVDDDGDNLIDDVHGWNFRDDSKEVFVDAGEDLHATHVAGTIGAVGYNGIGVAGVAWHVKIMSLKFLGGSKGSGSTGNAIKAIDYAIFQKNHGVNVRVINASWGGPGASQALRNKIQEAGDNGIVFVCSAGTDSLDNDGSSPDYPAAFAGSLSNVISVAAIGSLDNLAGFSNYGHAATTVAAPGESIWSTMPHTSFQPNGSYGQLSGTSMASPHVAGVVALLLSYKPELTPKQVKERIIATAEPTDALVSKVNASGRVNAFNALTNNVVAAERPRIVRVSLGKKSLTIDGFGFINNSAVIEIAGNAVDGTAYDSSYAVGNGTLTQLTAVLGKKPMKKKFPIGQVVNLTIFNPTTGERSAAFRTTRF
ncbi:MAG: thermitase [Blastocatellia bacterium]